MRCTFLSEAWVHWHNGVHVQGSLQEVKWMWKEGGGNPSIYFVGSHSRSRSVCKSPKQKKRGWAMWCQVTTWKNKNKATAQLCLIIYTNKTHLWPYELTMAACQWNLVQTNTWAHQGIEGRFYVISLDVLLEMIADRIKSVEWTTLPSKKWVSLRSFVK